jgi:hypothetical protein
VSLATLGRSYARSHGRWSVRLCSGSFTTTTKDKGCPATISSITGSCSLYTNPVTSHVARPCDTPSPLTMRLAIFTISFKLDVYREGWPRRLSRRATMPGCRPTSLAFTTHVQNHVNTTPATRTTSPFWLVTQHHHSLTTQYGPSPPFCYNPRAPHASRSRPYTP